MKDPVDLHGSPMEDIKNQEVTHDQNMVSESTQFFVLGYPPHPGVEGKIPYFLVDPFEESDGA
jgi:hypothetical protein